MIVRNVSNKRIEIPGTQPGFYFEFFPGDIKEVPYQLSGFVLGKTELQEINQDEFKKENIEKQEVPQEESIRTVTCEQCGKKLKSKDLKSDIHRLKIHLAKYHK